MKDGKEPPAAGEEDGRRADQRERPFKGGANAKVVIQEFSRLPVPVLQARRADGQADHRRPTATR